MARNQAMKPLKKQFAIAGLLVLASSFFGTISLVTNAQSSNPLRLPAEQIRPTDPANTGFDPAIGGRVLPANPIGTTRSAIPTTGPARPPSNQALNIRLDRPVVDIPNPNSAHSFPRPGTTGPASQPGSGPMYGGYVGASGGPIATPAPGSGNPFGHQADPNTQYRIQSSGTRITPYGQNEHPDSDIGRAHPHERPTPASGRQQSSGSGGSSHGGGRCGGLYGGAATAVCESSYGGGGFGGLLGQLLKNPALLGLVSTLLDAVKGGGLNLGRLAGVLGAAVGQQIGGDIGAIIAAAGTSVALGGNLEDALKSAGLTALANQHGSFINGLPQIAGDFGNVPFNPGAAGNVTNIYGPVINAGGNIGGVGNAVNNVAGNVGSAVAQGGFPIVGQNNVPGIGNVPVYDMSGLDNPNRVLRTTAPTDTALGIGAINLPAAASALTNAGSPAIGTGPANLFTPVSLIWETNKDEQISATQFPVSPNLKGTWFTWKASASMPLLIYDPSHTGKITSAEQLFGNFSFGKNWNNGYEALKSLDKNQDQKLSGRELNALALWFDENQDGISQKGEVKSLKSLKVVEIFTQPTSTELTSMDIQAEIGFSRKLDNGSLVYGKSVDWISQGGFSSKEEALKSVEQKAFLSQAL
ncbi:MAG: hypothetical protein SFU25_01550 [Candidatus Caenarcaniphilales bacterium]|nr:hypothetical protein [Candidatus Caenarcaniphilales bacterium]